ncbi:MAG: energy-coupling factor ABC transporter ATP-binding protein [Treponema sp.]|jgi:energy-coupling factor transport system ATP-binding protein|nr:energy-coupling factor ABC transporter ATP-binding protein [Treponema sp.]
MALVSLKNVGFEYPGGFKAVESVSIDIERGENVAILGQNGAGKTTTVKLCNRLLCPTEGDVFVSGKNTRHYTTAQISRIVGYVFQNPDDQIFHSSIESEVEFGPRMMKLSEEEIRERVNDALTISGLVREREENPYNLPLSVRKFITIASIIAMNTDVIILDEPTAGQDLAGNGRLQNIISTLLERGKTMITISHDMEFVAENFSRVIVMAERRVVIDGKPEDVFWDFKALEKARLMQPHVSRICRRLGIADHLIRLDDAVKAIMKHAAWPKK